MTPTGAWDWAFAWSILPQLLHASLWTIVATLLSFAGALVIGLPLAVARDSSRRSLRVPVGALVELVRSTPILVQVYFLYFVLPQVGIVLPALAVGVISATLSILMAPMSRTDWPSYS